MNSVRWAVWEDGNRNESQCEGQEKARRTDEKVQSNEAQQRVAGNKTVEESRPSQRVQSLSLKMHMRTLGETAPSRVRDECVLNKPPRQDVGQNALRET